LEKEQSNTSILGSIDWMLTLSISELAIDSAETTLRERLSLADG
jgi:hypothetical protein